MNILIERTIELNAPLLTEPLPGSLFTTEAKAHQFLIGCTQSGAPVTLSGTVSAKFIREANNTTILMSGSISGGKASLILPADCYNISGRFDLTIFVTSNNVTTCVYSATGSVKAAQDGTLVDEGTVVPSIEQLQQDVTNLQNNKVNRAGDTMTGSLNVPGLNALGNYPGMTFRQSAGATPAGYITENIATRRMYFTVVPTDAGGNEVFNLPAPSTGNTNQLNFDILTTKSAKIVPVYDTLCAWGNYAIGTTITLSQPYTNFDEIIVFSGWNSTSGGNWVNIFPVPILMSPDRVLAVMGSGINTGGESMRKSLTVVDSTHITVSDGYGDNTNILIRQIYGKRYTITA